MIYKNILPPFVYAFLKKYWTPKYGWFGNYSSWQSALMECSGYDDPRILQYILNAALQVKLGKAVFERDGVVFYKPQYNYPLLSSLLYCSNSSNHKLHLLDFGGSLGSVYFQHKAVLNNMNEFSWNVIEQKHFVVDGVKNIEDDILHFYKTIDECSASINIAVFSSSLQYLEKPYNILNDVFSLKIKNIVIDLTPIHKLKHDYIVKQISQYNQLKTSYPCRLFQYDKFISFFYDHGYKTLFDTNAYIQPKIFIENNKVPYKFLTFQKL